MRVRGAVIALVISLAVVLSIAPHAAQAAVIDGKLDPDYGAALTTQTTRTSVADNAMAIGEVNLSLGSELDEGYGFVSDGVLYLFMSGNLTFYWNIEGLTVWLPLDVFIDSTPGGQNQLLANNPSPDVLNGAYNLNMMAGLTFDTGFAADYWLSVGGNLYTWPNLQAYYGELPSAGGGAGAFLGTTLCGGPGVLAGGTNPYGIQMTIDESNVAGVGYGCAAASGAGVTTGIEWAIPLAAIGNPTDCIKVCAFVSSGDHSSLFNQVLGPLPAGTCSLGAASAVNFASIPGAQYFTVCSGPTPTRPTSWGRLKTIYR